MEQIKTISGMGIYSKILVNEEDFEIINKIHNKYIGNCPSGPTFNSHDFWNELKNLFPNYEKKHIGNLSKLPWGNIIDKILFTKKEK